MIEKQIWENKLTPAKLTKYDKEALRIRVDKIIKSSEKLSMVVNSFDIRAGRVYIYHLVEQFGWDDPNAKFKKPLIDGRYNKFPLARIMLIDAIGENCRLDWQYRNRDWIHLEEGSLEVCIKFIEEDDWFRPYFLHRRQTNENFIITVEEVVARVVEIDD